MLEAIRLENFKAIGAAQSVPIRPITLIFGANNSGKSSILQALLLLKQTLEDSESPGTPLLTRGSLADLHSLAMLRHRPPAQDPRVSVSLRMAGSFGTRLGNRVPGVGIPDVPRGALPNPWMTFRFDSHRQADVLLESCAIGNDDWDNELARFTNLALSDDVGAESRGRREDIADGRWVQLSSLQQDHAAMLISWERFQAARTAYLDAKSGEWSARGEKHSGSYNLAFSQGPEGWMSMDFPEFVNTLTDVYAKPVRLRHFLPQPPTVHSPEFRAGRRRHPLEELDLIDPRAMSGNLARRLGMLLRTDTEYTGIRRFGDERYYIYSGSRAESVGATGQRTPDILFAEPESLRRVNEWLAHFGIGATVEIHHLEDGKSSSAFFLELLYAGSHVRVQLPDVGSGLRQFLPVLLQSVASRNKLLLIEEPESHLHPRLQAQLGDLFVQSALENKNQLLVETHSEHLVLRIQSLVRRGVIQSGDVSILFVRGSQAGARVEPLRLDGDGDFIDEWPEGFFPERLAEFL